jgi:hypothetical protein
LFGYLPFFVVVAWLVAWIKHIGRGTSWRWLLVKVDSYPLPFLFFLFDSNVLATSGYGGSCFALPVALC